MDLSEDDSITLMCSRDKKRLIVRKRISNERKEIFNRLVHIRHKNLAQILGVEESEPFCHSYEEYISGTTLAEILAVQTVPEETAVRWINEICSAAAVLHAQNPAIIHRDIKPKNIMLTSDGIIKLIDFDAAKNFSPAKQRDTEYIGTVGYAAPEQYGFAASTPRTDIYAIGITFREMITGSEFSETPYTGKYKSIIENCVALDPAKRYRDITELLYYLNLKQRLRVSAILTEFTGKGCRIYFAAVLFIIFLLFPSLVIIFEMNPAVYYLPFYLSLAVPPYLLITNPFGLWQRFPFLKSKTIPIKLVGIVLFLFMGALLGFLVLTVWEYIPVLTAL
jgi:hypothetical protein